MVFLVQKEVAERIVGQPPQMSLLSLAIQFYWQPKIITKVEATKFWPQPRVDSAILKLTLKSDIKYQIEDEFFKLIKVGFSAKRKKLSNNLKNGLKMSNQELDLIFKKLNLNLNIRAQELRSEDWFNLVKIIF
jgi:16S rRNA (adenine1518-N6/adenine1519-N6)-dimethyltransferase